MSHSVSVLPYLVKFAPKTPHQFDGYINVHSFDLDHTLIRPKRPKATFGNAPHDWKFMEYDTGPAINKLVEILKADTHACFVIFTNQGGVLADPSTSKSFLNFEKKILLILKAVEAVDSGEEFLNRLWIYSSTKKPAALSKKIPTLNSKPGKVNKHSTSGKSNLKPLAALILLSEKFDEMRKPATGLFVECNRDLKEILSPTDGPVNWKYYCGDAAGRSTDFSDSDKIFALNTGVSFKVPEDIFNKK
ncbi:polynucleotide 3'-phosphatase KNAG_0A05210 [Huiozyma naganishii CBS 8797]|uniref:DNA 3'-phosphatase n=1 Tax=Huiozyma naganishii (strain ATCC MYA-139 / BCRC 22969 / CBS 8797 / KCTC 17520 / NBRC 10181 / NCYC 3082 / Yp74L-3) TaxID=1071383 RepID=J7RTU0_HUIN7|nr:hypothetical protein KNAG_0A05210 [Kazachstania naganishii CBS 8797]CCK68187.1 hypothetical protein KNAG_0A05210 [Kazachstania naganishii CBS 8797]